MAWKFKFAVVFLNLAFDKVFCLDLTISLKMRILTLLEYQDNENRKYLTSKYWAPCPDRKPEAYF